MHIAFQRFATPVRTLDWFCQFDVNLPDDVSGLEELQYEKDEIHRKVEQVGGGPAATVPPVTRPHHARLVPVLLGFLQKLVIFLSGKSFTIN